MKTIISNSIKRFFLLTICFVSLVGLAQKTAVKDAVMAYPAPEGVTLNPDFTIKVRGKGQDWKPLPVYAIKVMKVEDLAYKQQVASMAYFDFSGVCEVAVTSVKTIETARIRPLSYTIPFRKEGNNTIIFELDKPANLSVEVNGDIFHNLHLFANPIHQLPKKKKTDASFVYFGPGIHVLPEGKLNIKSNQQVYIAGGAFIKGQINIDNAQNVKVYGSGIVDQDVRLGIRIAFSKNVEIDGVFASQCLVGGSDGVKITNVKSISYFNWGDGMNIMAANNVTYNRVFNRNSDDCTTVYATRKEFSGGCKNILMKNSTLWADVAHPIMIGVHGSTPNQDVIENVTYSNIDILDHQEVQIDYQGCMAIDAGDSNLIKNITFENIRVEDFRRGQLVNIRVFYNQKYCTSPGKGVEDILFKDISYNGTNAAMSVIAGYDENRKVKNVVFENLKINGKLIYDDMPGKPKWFKTGDIANMFIGEHAEGIVFKKTE